MEVKRDLLILFCSFLFYFAFLVLNATGSRENANFTVYDEPLERCIPRYENRAFTNELSHTILRCVKIGIPDIEYYEKSCEELNLTNPEITEECIIR